MCPANRLSDTKPESSPQAAMWMSEAAPSRGLRVKTQHGASHPSQAGEMAMESV